MSSLIEVQVLNRHPDRSWPIEPLRRLVEWVLKAEAVKPPCEVHLYLVHDAGIRRLNQRIFGRSYATDVISQPFSTPDDPDPLLGEVYLSLDRAAAEAAERELPMDEEVSRYAIHGLLHLLGYQDDEPQLQERMWERQEELLAEWRDEAR